MVDQVVEISSAASMYKDVQTRKGFIPEYCNGYSLAIYTNFWQFCHSRVVIGSLVIA